MKREIVKRVLFIASLFVFFAFAFPTWEIPEKYQKVKNPYPDKGLETGQKIYKKTCAVCHLADGKGNDVITPVDFTEDDFQKQSDGTLFYKISEGRKGTAMKAYGDDYPEKKVWYLVNYLRSFQKKNQSSD
jgi:mono/diheme cytochrome c family protein